MLQQLVDVQPPTAVIWTNLLHWYLFLGADAAIIVTAWMMYNIFSNRAKNVKQAPKFHEESGWGNWKTVLYTLMVTGTVLGFVEYQTFASANLITTPNGDPLTINVTGQQFAWIFTYPNGHTQIDNLTVPQNEIIQLNITSIDVDHSFSIQTMDVAKDALPGRYNTLWFNATQTGAFVDDIRCKELCGMGHAQMIGQSHRRHPGLLQQVVRRLACSYHDDVDRLPHREDNYVIIPSGVANSHSLNFQPASLTVASGTTITFVDQDSSTHNVDFTSVPPGATTPAISPDLKNGDTFQVTLTTAGTYHYQCDYHSGWMQGTITVTG